MLRHWGLEAYIPPLEEYFTAFCGDFRPADRELQIRFPTQSLLCTICGLPINGSAIVCPVCWALMHPEEINELLEFEEHLETPCPCCGEILDLST